MDITCLIFGSAFLVSGYLFSTGSMLKYIQAWNEMPNEEKQAIKIGPLCRNVGLCIGVAGFIFLLSGLVGFVREHAFVWLMIAWLIACGIDIWLIEKKRLYYIK